MRTECTHYDAVYSGLAEDREAEGQAAPFDRLRVTAVLLLGGMLRLFDRLGG